MQEKLFTLTAEQVKQIYRAGISRGQEEEASFQCGSRVGNSWQYDRLVDAIYIIENEGKGWKDKDYVDFVAIESWFKEKK